MNVRAKLIEPIPYFLKGGSIFFTQEAGEEVLSTQDLDDVFSVIIGLDDLVDKTEGRAKGNIIASDDFSEEYIYEHCVKDNKNCILTMNAQSKADHLIIQLSGEEALGSLKVNQLVIMGIPQEITGNIKQTMLEHQTELPIETTLLETGALILNFYDPLSLPTKTSYKFVFSS